MTTLEQITQAAVHGRSKDMERLVQCALDEGFSPSAILHDGVFPALSESGDAFSSDDSNILKILSTARCVRICMNMLEPYLEKSGELHIGKAIIGTVEGDLHEVGKNLVALLFRSSGMDVVDLGVDVTDRAFLKAVREHPEAQIVCISSLLTTALPEMRKCVRTLRKADREHKLCIMVGGGCVTQELADEMGADLYTDTAMAAANAALNYIRMANSNRS